MVWNLTKVEIWENVVLCNVKGKRKFRVKYGFFLKNIIISGMWTKKYKYKGILNGLAHTPFTWRLYMYMKYRNINFKALSRYSTAEKPAIASYIIFEFYVQLKFPKNANDLFIHGTYKSLIIRIIFSTRIIAACYTYFLNIMLW